MKLLSLVALIAFSFASAAATYSSLTEQSASEVVEQFNTTALATDPYIVWWKLSDEPYMGDIILKMSDGKSCLGIAEGGMLASEPSEGHFTEKGKESAHQMVVLQKELLRIDCDGIGDYSLVETSQGYAVRKGFQN